MFQIFLILFIIGQAFYFQHRLNQLQNGFASRTMPPDSLYRQALSNFLKHFRPEQQQFTVNATGNQQQNLFSIHLNLQKNWVVTVWRNGSPVVAQSVQQDSVFRFDLPLEEGENLFRLLVLNNFQEKVYQDEFHLTFFRPLVRLFNRSVEQGSIRHRLIALTFDGGSDDAHTREILQILRDHHLHCTLFLTGRFMQKHPDLVKQMVTDGHEIGNHTYSHPHLTTFAENHQQKTRNGVSRAFVQHQLLRTDSVFFALTGQHLKPFWRAPFGEYNRQILQWAAEVGYLHIRWTPQFDTYDWVTDRSSRLYRTPEEIFHHFMTADSTRQHGLNGVIVLMHLGSHRDNHHVFEALPQLIHTLTGRGYRFVTVSELLKNSNDGG